MPITRQAKQVLDNTIPEGKFLVEIRITRRDGQFAIAQRAVPDNLLDARYADIEQDKATNLIGSGFVEAYRRVHELPELCLTECGTIGLSPGEGGRKHTKLSSADSTT